MSDCCHELHQLLNGMKRFQFPFNENEIPKNGIYILFEKGELGHGADRVVRIGTHTGKNQLPSRLMQHFLNENKDRSIFRKNIGRALLAKENNPFLKEWELDLTTKKAKEQFSNAIDFEKQNEIEKKVSGCIQGNFSFAAFGVENKSRRMELESKLISTISNCELCIPSKNWLGNFSPKLKIRESGLWLVNELYKMPLTLQELEELKLMITGSEASP